LFLSQARNSTVGSNWTEDGPSILEEVRPGEVSFEIKNLKPDTFYKVEIRAHNAIGFSEPTGIIVKTAKGEFLLLLLLFI